MLFNEYEAPTAAGRRLADELHEAVGPILRRAIGVREARLSEPSIGNSIEVEHIAVGVVQGICAELRILNALNLRQLERELSKLEKLGHPISYQRDGREGERWCMGCDMPTEDPAHGVEPT